MRSLLILLFAALTAAAQNPPREHYPSDYKPQPCAPEAAAVCSIVVSPAQIRDYGTTFRGYDIHTEWIDAHYEEMVQAFLPLCAKIANCLTLKNNDWIFCVDIMREDFLAQCDRFPAGSKDRDQCSMFAMTYYIALGPKSKLQEQTRSCVAQLPPATGERTLEAWFSRPSYPIDFEGEVMIHAIDAETRIPVHAKISTDSDAPLRSTEGPVPTAGYASKWKARLARVPAANGRRELVAPNVTLTADGYKPLTMRIPLDATTVVAEMLPKQLRRGKNKFTVTMRDSATGQPVRGRVMAGDVYLGDTNQVLELILRGKEKAPEIWVMSLYDKYGDVVVAPAAK